MLVHLDQYQHDDADDSVRSAGAVSPETSAEDYFGSESVEAGEWERVDLDGETVLRRSSSHDGIAAVSVPEERADGDDPDLPGRTIQLRTAGGETRYVEQAVIVEVQDADPG